jgi:hypothetical protein
LINISTKTLLPRLDPDIDLLLEAKRVLFPALSDRLTTTIYCFYTRFGKTLGLPPPAMFI